MKTTRKILRVRRGCAHPRKLRYPVTWVRGGRTIALCMACERLHEVKS